MFEDATFDSRNVEPSKTPRWMLLALMVNGMLFGAGIGMPLLYPASLPSRLLTHVLFIPMEPVKIVPKAQMARVSTATATALTNLFSAPTTVPTLISTEPVGDPPNSGDAGALEAADAGPGAEVSSLFQSAPQPVVKKEQAKKMTISQGVSTGLLLQRVDPVYPVIAKSAGVSGTVVLEAVIAADGRIDKLRVQSGSPMLRQAALDAVKQWKYRPYLLNEQPIEVETTITIVFNLGTR